MEAGRSLAEARAMMDEHAIHHLPVTEGGALHGILSDRELRVARRSRATEAGVTVGEVCRLEPLVVDLNAGLDDVVSTMAARYVSAALVTREGKLCGILTTTDVCRLLAELLRAGAPPDVVA
ncbi:MAG: CBS domain-containing protein [Nannocystaceae bacterium]